MKTHTTNRRKGQFRRVLVEQLETRMLLAIGPMPTYPVAPVDAAVAACYSSAGGTNTMSQSATVSSPATPAFNLAQTLSDQAQLTTLAFDGLAMMTGNLDAQSFFPPGNTAVLDYETTKSFTLKIQATDNGVPALAGTGTVTIKLTNVNERPTNISLSSTSIAENKPAGSVVGILARPTQTPTRRLRTAWCQASVATTTVPS